MGIMAVLHWVRGVNSLSHVMLLKSIKMVLSCFSCFRNGEQEYASFTC